MEKLKMHSPDLTQENIARIQGLFPNCVTETRDKKGNLKLAVDFDQLRQELSDSIIEGPQERYHLNWPGKREALLTANAPIAKTLRPCREESVNFDTTKNIFIEGDNLEALKLLQESYLGKVKMIYIDPPYNTGNDFIYEDDFAQNSEEYFRRSNQKDDQGNRLVPNPESNGQRHSDWLSLMYSRLKLSRNLLRDDGVIFCSIDEGEVANLIKIFEEVFGKGNHIANFIWQNKKGGGNDAKHCAVEHEYIVLFAKNKEFLPKLFESFSDEYAKRYRNEDSEGRFFWDTFKRKSGKQYYPIVCPDGQILEFDEYGNRLSWLRSEARFKDDLKKGDVKFELRNGGWSVMFKQRMPEGKKPRSLILDKGTTSDGSKELLTIFQKNIFDNPKPISLMTHLIGIILKDNDLVLDFFAGSGTIAHAMMQMNANNGVNCKFILVQLPEICKEESEAYNTGYKNITEISKERIRRGGKTILDGHCHENWDKDVGFRVFKIDSSNMKDVYYRPDDTTQMQLDFLTNNVKHDRTDEDLLFQVLQDWGVYENLSLPIRKEVIQSKTVFFVDENALVACFDKNLSEEFVKKLTDYKPLRVVFRDTGFASDAVKINVEQIFKQMSPETEVRTI